MVPEVLQSPMLTFINHPDFKPVRQNSNFTAWHWAVFVTFRNLFVNNQFISFDYLSGKLKRDGLTALQYVRNIVGTIQRKGQLRKTMTEFELLLQREIKRKKALSKI